MAGMIPVVSTALQTADRLGALKVRWNIGRMSYAIPPRLYAVGNPGADSPVLVTANYKLTFDRLRQELSGLNAWLLVLDTQGVNVWCAAGKGTFGTDELVRRIEAVHLGDVVTHRTLLLPQLGAPGVAAPEVRQRSGFGVVYGPVYAQDIRAFLAAGMVATPAMRRVHFKLMDRLAVIPVELTAWFPYWLLLTALLCLAAGFLGGGWGRSGGVTLLSGLAFLAGGAVVPALLPWIPGRAFAAKGAVVGVLLAYAIFASGMATRLCGVRSSLELAAWWLLLPVITSFLALNFTGATTFTSQSGVKYEMRFAMPILAAGLIAGLGLFAAAQMGGGR